MLTIYNTELRERLENALGASLDAPAEFHRVREVAPNKTMYCISFVPPAAIALCNAGEMGLGQAGLQEEEPESKRAKTDAV